QPSFIAIAHGEVADVTALVHQPTRRFSATAGAPMAETAQMIARPRALKLIGCMTVLPDASPEIFRKRDGPKTNLRVIASWPFARPLPPRPPLWKQHPKIGCGGGKTPPFR